MLNHFLIIRVIILGVVQIHNDMRLRIFHMNLVKGKFMKVIVSSAMIKLLLLCFEIMLVYMTHQISPGVSSGSLVMEKKT